MPILTYATHEKINASRSLDLCFICSALSSEVLGITVKDVDVFLRYIHMVEEVFRHE